MVLSLIVMEVIFQDTIILNSKLIEDTLRMIFDNFHIQGWQNKGKCRIYTDFTKKIGRIAIWICKSGLLKVLSSLTPKPLTFKFGTRITECEKTSHEYGKNNLFNYFH